MKTAGDLLSENMKALRKQRGWTQEKLAEMAGLNLNSVARFEGRLRFPREDNLAGIAAALGVPEARLFADPDVIPEPSLEDALKVVREKLGIEIKPVARPIPIAPFEDITELLARVPDEFRRTIRKRITDYIADAEKEGREKASKPSSSSD